MQSTPLMNEGLVLGHRVYLVRGRFNITVRLDLPEESNRQVGQPPVNTLPSIQTLQFLRED